MNFDRGPETVGLVTVTAPGAPPRGPLACSAETCGHKGEHAQRGKQGCRVDRQLAREWNATAQDRWSELHRRAQQRARRESGLPFTTVARVWQMQERGVLHLHVVVPWGTEPEKIASKRYVAALRELAEAWGFGHIDFRDRAGKAGRAAIMESRRAAGYLSGYVTDSEQLEQAVVCPERPQRLVHVSRRLTLSTGCTMTRLRRARYVYVLRRLYGSCWSAVVEPAWLDLPGELGLVEALLAPGPP